MGPETLLMGRGQSRWESPSQSRWGLRSVIRWDLSWAQLHLASGEPLPQKTSLPPSLGQWPGVGEGEPGALGGQTSALSHAGGPGVGLVLLHLGG